MLALAAPLDAGGPQVELLAGSVLDYEGDAFVNAANEGCVGGFGVDELVNRAGGPAPQLQGSIGEGSNHSNFSDQSPV